MYYQVSEPDKTDVDRRLPTRHSQVCPLILVSKKSVKVMGQFFHGWRRKLGLTTLLLALAFLAEWGRSHQFMDLAYLRTGPKTAQMVVSDRRGMVWIGLFDPDEISLSESFCHSQKAVPRGILEDLTTEWHWEWYGFQRGHGREKQSDWGGGGELGTDQMLPVAGSSSVATILIIPCWAFILPLTLCSGYLLLHQSRCVSSRKNAAFCAEPQA